MYIFNVPVMLLLVIHEGSINSKNVITAKVENKKDIILAEIEEAGLNNEEIHDLNRVASLMSKFLGIIPNLSPELGFSSKENIMQETQV